MRACISKNRLTVYTVNRNVHLRIIDDCTLEFIDVWPKKRVYSSSGIVDCINLVEFLLVPFNSMDCKTYSQYESAYFSSLHDTVKIILKKESFLLKFLDLKPIQVLKQKLGA